MAEPEAECVVCGAKVAVARSAGLLFVGKRWFFCGMPHRLAFKREPERWITARPEAGVAADAAPFLPRTRPGGPFKVR